MKTIYLTRGLTTTIDDADYIWAAQHTWYAQSRRGYFYAARWDNTTNPRKIISLHREIMDAPAGSVVDHIDGNQLNNTRTNLRVVSRSANNQNSVKRPSGSKYRGVRELKRKTKPSKWRAVLNHEGVRYDGGCFDLEEEAARAYNEMAKTLGSLTPLNEVI